MKLETILSIVRAILSDVFTHELVEEMMVKIEEEIQKQPQSEDEPIDLEELAQDRRQIDEAIRILSIDGINSKQKAKDILRGVRYRGGTQG